MLFVPVISSPTQPNPSTCYLVSDSWDDFGYKTTFTLFYADPQGGLLRLGRVKITYLGQPSSIQTAFKDSFPSLGSAFCSIGSSQGYYEELAALPDDVREAILVGLRDCVHDETIVAVFAQETAFRTSLMRDSDPESSRKLYKTILQGNVVPSKYHFKYTIPEASGQEIDIRVVPESLPPTNVHVLIGRNGVGKTRLLSGIADAITRNQNPNGFSFQGVIEFANAFSMFGQPGDSSNGFANLVAVAFSAFDGFRPIAQTDVIGNTKYNYVGLRKEDEADRFKDETELTQEFCDALSECLTGLKLKRWCKIVRILGSDPVFAGYDFPTVAHLPDAQQVISNNFSQLSSGHKIILLTVTRLVQLVNERTLVLIDEPENHLHPPLLSSFVRAISELMSSRNGVALIATHSPVVLQEVPKNCVTIVDKARSEYRFLRPETETFAENVGSLTKEVFNLEITHSGYHALLQSHMATMSYEDLLKAFRKQIGREGRTIARSLEVIASSRGDQ